MEKRITRRSFVGGAAAIGAIAALGTSASTAHDAFAGEGEKPAAEETQYGFWVDTDKCDGCGECAAACREANETPEGMESRRKIESLYDDFGNVSYVTTSCMHCSVPSCEKVCPAGAISKRADGIVCVNSDRCIGCKYCYHACPFSVPHYGKDGMDKCDCCLGAGVAAGDAPNCVQACKKGALHYGKVEDLIAMSGHRAKSIEAPTGPNCLFS